MPDTGEAVVCVDNGHGGTRATAGWVEIGGVSVVEPSDFNQDVELIARPVELQGNSSMSVRIAGKPGSAFRVRVYGAHPECDGVFKGQEVIAGEQVFPREWEPVSSAPRTDVLGEGEGAKPVLGCGMSGASMAWVGALLLAALLWRNRRAPAPVRFRGRRSSR
jgi:hypothetical protein